MEFIISKTSEDFDDDCNLLPPHPNSYQKKYNRIEGRTCTEEYFDKHFGDREGLWRSKGIDHVKTEGGKHIQRRLIADNEGYFIRLDTLDELIDFIDKNGSVVLQQKDDFVEIEIYNGYRE